MYLTVTEDGKIILEPTDVLFLCRWSGLKSRKHRHVKKRIKNIITKALIEYIDSQKQNK